MMVRATPEEGEGTFMSVVSTYNLDYDIGWGWTERILPGCFADSIASHPALPIFYNHDWLGAPIGVGKASEGDDKLTVAGRLYLDMGDPLVARVYQAMKDEALQEWSIGFWPESITNDKDAPYCDQIAKGDLAEASVCVRGANPDTGTLELNGRQAYIAGDETARRQEVSRLRRMFTVPDLSRARGGRRRADEETTPGELAQSVDALIDQIVILLEADDTQGALDLCLAADSTLDDLLELLGVPDDDDIADSEGRRRAAGHTHGHTHDGGQTSHSHAHTHSGGSYDHDASDAEVAHTHSHEPETPPPSEEDPGVDENTRARLERAFGDPRWSADLAAAVSHLRKGQS